MDVTENSHGVDRPAGEHLEPCQLSRSHHAAGGVGGTGYHGAEVLDRARRSALRLGVRELRYERQSVVPVHQVESTLEKSRRKLRIAEGEPLVRRSP